MSFNNATEQISNVNSNIHPKKIPNNMSNSNNTSNNKIYQKSIFTTKKYRKLFLGRIKKIDYLNKMMEQFINRFHEKPPHALDQSEIIFSFIEQFIENLKQYSPWKTASVEEIDAITDILEKYIMTLLFKYCFSPSSEDIEKDKYIYRKFNKLQFIEYHHLDISQKHIVYSDLINRSIEQLRKINEYKAPKDKLICIFNCCTLIYSILNKAYAQGDPAGADEFLPLLIYVVLKSNPPQIHSNIQYISRFRNPSKMSTEMGYYFTHLVSAVTFIENIDASKLTISEEEFNFYFNNSNNNNNNKISNKNISEANKNYSHLDDKTNREKSMADIDLIQFD